MKLKLQGQANYPATHGIEVVDENTIILNGETYEFPPDVVEYDCAFPIMSATRTDGVLSVHLVVGYCDDDMDYWQTNRPYGQEEWEEFGPGVIEWL